MASSITMTGFILSIAPSLAAVDDAIRRGGYNALKVITGWGLVGGWTPTSILQATRLVPTLIVRTRTGDPGIDGRFGGDFTFVDQHRVVQEIAPWYAARPDIWIELGNEPNVFPVTDKQMYDYAYFLGTAIQRCRQEFPRAKLIAPAMSLGTKLANAPRFLQICRSAMLQADAVALHAYEYSTFDGPVSGRTGQLELALKLAGELFADKQWLLTEYGINEPKLSAAAKGAAYAKLLHQRQLPTQLVGATYYHLAIAQKVDHPEYHIYPAGDLSYHHTRWPA